MAKLTLYEEFNGKRTRAVNEFSSRTKAVKWMRDWGVLPKWHKWVLINEDNEEVGFSLEDTRTVKPMGWGFKTNWEDKPGTKATNLSVYKPARELRRV